MKPVIRFLTFFCCIVLIIGCQKATFKTPPQNAPYMMIFHVKEPTLTFIDAIENKVLFSTESLYSLSSMTAIEPETIIGTSVSRILCCASILRKVQSNRF